MRVTRMTPDTAMVSFQESHYECVSDLLRAVVEDGRAILRDPYYRPASHVWHKPERGKSCFICLAGAFMVGSLQAEGRGRALDPLHFPEPYSQVLFSLNHLRNGGVCEALNELYKFCHRVPYPLLPVTQQFIAAHDRFAVRFQVSKNFHDAKTFEQHLALVSELADWLAEREI